LLLWRCEGLAEEVEDGADPGAVSEILVYRLPNLSRLRAAFDWDADELSVVVGDEARQ
jgi:hypothetical protein